MDLRVISGAVVIATLAPAALVACGEDALPHSIGPTAVASAPSTATTPPSVVGPARVDVAAGQASRTVDAANAFIDMLTADQRSRAVYDFDSPLRPNWSNLPAGVLRFERNGVRAGDLATEQADLMYEFLKLALSPDGYSTVVEVIGAEAELASSPRAGRLGWSIDNYWLAFFGEPSAVGPWAWQFGGHHLAVNVTVIEGRSYLSPTLVGIEPASYGTGGSRATPLEAELESGLALVSALDDDQRRAAEVQSRPRELLAGAGQDRVIPPLEGSRVAGWSPALRERLMDIAALWVGLLPEASAQARLSEIRTDLDDTYFAWNGSFDGTGSIYYRIQGPTLIVEFSTQGNLGGDGGHYHSIYRDPTNEYGARAAGGR